MDNTTKQSVRTRFAPSPTGRVHIGSIQKIIFSYVCAKSAGGQYVLRIEDTDQTRLVEGSEEEFYLLHEKLGINIDESPRSGGKYGPYRQSERLDIYKKYAEELVGKGFAYYAFDTPEELSESRFIQQKAGSRPRYLGGGRDLSLDEARVRIANGEKYVVRAKLPKEGEIITNCMIMGDVKFRYEDLDDYILLKSDGFPTYHLAVVVDDHLMEISHAFRGVEWLPTFPLHVFLYQSFGWELPIFGHIPNILDPKGGKLSKRSGSVAAMDFIAKGYLPSAMINFLTLLGWSPKNDQEMFGLAEFISKYDPKNFNKSNPVFNYEKLNWFNELYIRQMSPNELLDSFKNYVHEYQSESVNFQTVLNSLPEDKLRSALLLEQERITLLSDLESKLLNFVKQPENLDWSHKLTKKLTTEQIIIILENYKAFSQNYSEMMPDHDTWESFLRELAGKLELKPGNIFMAVRVAVTGEWATPPLYEFVEVIGWEEHNRRIETALDSFANAS